MAIDEEIKNRILQITGELFFKQGFNNVSMDTIASTVGISKRTLYKYSSSKEHLLHEVIKLNLVNVEFEVKKFLNNDEIDFIEKFKFLMVLISSCISKFSAFFLSDVKKMAPQAWNEINEFRQTAIVNNFGKLYLKGVKEGVFRSDIDEKLTLIIYSSLIEHILNPYFLSQIPFSANNVFDAIVKIYFEGVMTDKARLKYCFSQEKNKPEKEDNL